MIHESPASVSICKDNIPPQRFVTCSLRKMMGKGENMITEGLFFKINREGYGV